MDLRTVLRTALVVLAVLALSATPALAAPAVSGEFDVPNLGSNNKIVQGPDGNMWVTLNGAEFDVARITPAGEVKEFKLEAVTPLGITAAPDGLLWVARNGGVISFNPSDPEGTKQLHSIALIGSDPQIASGPDGNLWVASANKLVKVPPANPAGATEVPIPGLVPKDIDAAGSLLVVASFEHVYAVDTTGNVVGDQKVGGQAQGVAGNPNGQYAFTQPVNTPKEIGLLAPGTAPIIRSAEGTDPFGIALGSDGAYWSAEFISDGLTRITADGQVSGITGFAKNSAPRQIAAGPGNTLWVTLEMTKKVGRVSGLEPPVAPTPPSPPSLPPVPEPRTKIGKGPKGKVLTPGKRAKVKFAFSSPDPGSGFECRLLALGKKKKKAVKASPFKACESPKRYRLVPGRYRFEVRAVLNGARDATPAKRSFRVVRAIPID